MSRFEGPYRDATEEIPMNVGMSMSMSMADFLSKFILHNMVKFQVLSLCCIWSEKFA
jgi:hypothetical protein